MGLLHADTTATGGRALDALDAEVAARFSEGLGGVFERAVLRETLQLHHQELQSAIKWMSGRLGQLAADGGDRPRRGGADPGGVDALTARELEVLRLLARGQTNLAIANALVVREGTVKYHVKNILRKLGATSRADAVSRYVRAGGGGGMSTATLGPELISGPPGEQLLRRLELATDHARRLLGLPDDPGTADLARLRALIVAVREQLPPEQSHAAAIDEQEAALARLRQRFEGRFEALERIQAAVGDLREVTSPRAMLARAPAALCAGSAFERAIVSLVRGGRMIAEAAHFAGAGQARVPRACCRSFRPTRCGSSIR